MAFLFGLVVGAVIGVGLVAAFVRSENSRSRQRFELAAAISAFSKMTVEDSKKILPAEYYPSWVVFTHRQKLNWLNLELTKIWPYVNEAASDLIRSSVEPVLEQYKSVFLDSLKFSKLTLGTIAPQFTVIFDREDGLKWLKLLMFLVPLATHKWTGVSLYRNRLSAWSLLGFASADGDLYSSPWPLICIRKFASLLNLFPQIKQK